MENYKEITKQEFIDAIVSNDVMYVGHTDKRVNELLQKDFKYVDDYASDIIVQAMHIKDKEDDDPKKDIIEFNNGFTMVINEQNDYCYYNRDDAYFIENTQQRKTRIYKVV